ncbi:MAG TPA: CoA-binding protein [Planctomycetia bacterium]|nr:CoA-binding protein [Planctomycetia bacterium]
MSRTVAIIGASADRSKFGNKSIRAHLQAGYSVIPIHPTASEIEGLPCFPSIEAVTVRLDRVSLYVPPHVGTKLLEAIAAKRPAELWVNPGAESQALLERARELGLKPILDCSIVDLGLSPSQFP